MLALAVYLLFFPIAMTWADHQGIKPAEEKRHYGPQPTPLPEKPCAKLCVGTKANRTIITKNGKVFCLVPTEEELLRQLKESGGYNPHYVAVTMEEAEANFVNLLPKTEKPKPTYLPGHGHGHRHGHGRGRGRGRGHAWGKIHRPLTSGDSKVEYHDVSTKQKREADSSPSCTEPKCVDKGTKTSDGIRICPACQRCRELSTTLFPRIVNEVTCDKSDSGLSQTMYCSTSLPGKCKQKTMTIDVLSKERQRYELVKKDGTDEYHLQIWDRVTIEIKSCCECYLQLK